ncbi:26948_t:CDS:1, partial [Gigaspora margarita]
PETEREDSSSSLTSLEFISDTNTPNETNTSGQNLSPVWAFFQREKTLSSGHFLAKCSYCTAKWSRSEPQKLEAYLALECPNMNSEIWQIYLLHVASHNNFEEQSENLASSKKTKLNNNLAKYFP